MDGFKNFFLTESALGVNATIDNHIVRLYLSGKKVGEIENETGKWRSHIYELLKKEGIYPHRLNQQRELTIQMSSSGVSSRKIAEITSQTERNVREVLNKNRKQYNATRNQQLYW
jgi:hypothetical protein